MCFTDGGNKKYDILKKGDFLFYKSWQKKSYFLKRYYLRH